MGPRSQHTQLNWKGRVHSMRNSKLGTGAAKTNREGARPRHAPQQIGNGCDHGTRNSKPGRGAATALATAILGKGACVSRATGKGAAKARVTATATLGERGRGNRRATTNWEWARPHHAHQQSVNTCCSKTSTGRSDTTRSRKTSMGRSNKTRSSKTSREHSLNTRTSKISRARSPNTRSSKTSTGAQQQHAQQQNLEEAQPQHAQQQNFDGAQQQNFDGAQQQHAQQQNFDGRAATTRAAAKLRRAHHYSRKTLRTTHHRTRAPSSQRNTTQPPWKAHGQRWSLCTCKSGHHLQTRITRAKVVMPQHAHQQNLEGAPAKSSVFSVV